MPKYFGKITKDLLKFHKKAALLKWMAANAGLFFEVTIKVLGKAKDRKTREQLGYYWALLLPEILDQYIADGMTITVNIPKVKIKGESMVVDIKPSMDDSHEVIKDVCALVGEDGSRLDVRDMDKHTIRKFIDNVLYHATFDLLMDGDKLKAQRPKG